MLRYSAGAVLQIMLFGIMAIQVGWPHVLVLRPLHSCVSSPVITDNGYGASGSAYGIRSYITADNAAHAECPPLLQAFHSIPKLLLCQCRSSAKPPTATQSWKLFACAGEELPTG